jgi:uncharacterized protein
VYERLGRFFLKYRLATMLVIFGITGFLTYQIRYLHMESPVIDQFPSNHEYVQTFLKYSSIFSGASRVVIQLQVKEGDIFNPDTLEKVDRITKALELLPGINNYQVTSLAHRKVKVSRYDTEKGVVRDPVMWPNVAKTPEEIAALKKRIFTAPGVMGVLVSRDIKATLIVAGFFDKELNPKLIYQRINQIVSKEIDSNTSIQVIGRPIMLGYVLARMPELFRLFLFTVISVLIVLTLYFRDYRGVLVPMVTAFMSTLMGLGFMGLLRINFDPLIIVVPFIISARALSHSVQLIERYYEEYGARRDRVEAAVATFSGLFIPGVVGVLADVIGVMLVWLTPIPLLKKLALSGGFWVTTIIISNVIFNPVLLSYLSPPSVVKKTEKKAIDRFMAMIAGWTVGRGRYVIFGATGVAIIVAFLFARLVVIGDVNPGTPMLWPDSKYNLDTAAIAAKFRNTDELTVVIEGKTADTIKNPEVLRTMGAFQRYMELLPEVGSTSSIADLLPGTTALYHGNDPKWELLPEDPAESGFFMEMVFSGSEPGDMVRFATIDKKNANITVNLLDHKGETLRKVVAHAKKFIAENPLPGAKFRLAGGLGGLTAAINEVVTRYEIQITVLAFIGIFLICAWSYKSVLAGILFLIPLGMSNYLCYALMGAKGIGMDINSLPVVSLGVGLGVDYGLYIISRTKEEFAVTKDVAGSITTAICTSGKAVLFTAGTMVLGVVFWAFSFMKFQADMGLLLVFWMIMSMTGSLTILPALVYVLKPKFVFGDLKKK